MTRVAFQVRGVGEVIGEVDDDATLGDIRRALNLPGDDDDHRGLRESGFRCGSVWGARLPPPDWGFVRLEVVGGPYCGESCDLPRGSEVTVGSGRWMLVRLVDPEVAEVHLRLRVADLPAREPDSGQGTDRNADAEHLVQISPQEGCEVLVDGELVDQPVSVGEGALIQVGSSILRVGIAPAPDGDVSDEGVGVGRTGFNRGSRVRGRQVRPVVRLPGEKPEDSGTMAFSWLAAVVPAGFGVVMALVLGQPRFLFFAAFSPLMVVASYFGSRKMAKRTGRRTVETWRGEVREAKASIDRFAAAQRRLLWDTFASPVRVMDDAEGPTARLWERRKGDDDALKVRVGVGVSELDVQLDGPAARRDGLPVSVGVGPCPIMVDLADGVVGVCGPRPVVSGLGRAMMCHLVTARSPRDLQVVVICGENAGQWEWMRWLPHADGGRARANVGNTRATRRARVRELITLIETRERAASQVGFGDLLPAGGPDVVVLIDQSRAYRMVAGLAMVLERGPAVGVHVIALDTEPTRLPQECAVEIAVDAERPTTGTVRTRDRVIENVLLDGFACGFAERTARALAPIVHVAGAGDDNMLPDQARLIDILDIDLERPQDIVDEWRLEPRRTQAVVGAGPGGEPFELDLALDGPHALVAGTTGAGKSEFLQSLVISLALVNRPDALNFVLIDYKGGSAFADCARLPHTVGMVTNLDQHGTQRALDSLDAEVRRREEVLASMGAKDADAAWDKDAATASRNSLARLVLVIDEFAELKAELPGFIDGLIRIARVGRSLGIHLVMATQRPAGAITGEMQSNTNLRIALRVTDKQDSTDVLGSHEAALISRSTPGRAYARLGEGVPPSAFQTGRVAGRRPGAAAVGPKPPRLVTSSWATLGEPLALPEPTETTGPIDHEDTDLRALVDLVIQAHELSGVAKPRRPWLPDLVDHIPLDELTSSEPGRVILGLEDIPSRQAQVPLEWDPLTATHTLIVGGARSGRTSLLRVIAAQLAAYSPWHLNMYFIDYAGGALTPFERLPHTGAVATPREPGRARRLLETLQAEVARRTQVLAAGGYGSIAEQRAAGHDQLPYIVFMIDGFERLLAEDGDDSRALEDGYIALLREGPAVGLRLVITCDRTLLSARFRSHIPVTYALPLADRDDYNSLAIKPATVPTHLPPGRLLWTTGQDTLHEAQAPLLPGDASGQGQQAALIQLIQDTRAKPLEPAPSPVAQPLRVDPLPSAITLPRALALPVAAGNDSDGITLAVGGNTLSRYTIDMTRQTRVLIAGHGGTGRSTALATALIQLHAKGCGVVVIAPKESILTDTAQNLGAPIISDDIEDPGTFLEIAQAADTISTAHGWAKVWFLCDDADMIKTWNLQKQILANSTEIHLWVTVHPDDAHGGMDSVITDARRARYGLVLSPTSSAAGYAAFDTNIPGSLQGRRPPGGGLLWGGRAFTAVQVPTPAGDVS